MVQELHDCPPQRSRRRLHTPQYDAKFGDRNRRKFSLARLRIREIERLIEYRDGVVPDTDDADRPIWLVAQHMREISPINLHGRLSQCCSRWAPDFPEEQIKKIADKVVAKSYFFSADKIGKLLGLKDEERKALGIKEGAGDKDDRRNRPRQETAGTRPGRSEAPPGPEASIAPAPAARGAATVGIFAQQLVADEAMEGGGHFEEDLGAAPESGARMRSLNQGASHRHDATTSLFQLPHRNCRRSVAHHIFLAIIKRFSCDRILICRRREDSLLGPSLWESSLWESSLWDSSPSSDSMLRESIPCSFKIKQNPKKQCRFRFKTASPFCVILRSR
jgi:hypothetical protein